MPITYTENDYLDLVTTGPEFGATPKYKVLVEGDSWVSHPFISNLAFHLDNLGNDEFAMLNLAVPGDTARRMFSRGSRQLRKLDQLLHDDRFGYDFDMIFISAAGNDIVGEEIIDFVDKHNTGGRTGVDLINSRFEEILNDIVDDYTNLIKLRNGSTINKETPIVCHCYSYLKPRKVGTKLFGTMFGKGWVKQYLDKQGIPQADQQAIIIEMLDRFYNVIKALENEYTNFLVVDTREALMKNGRPNVSLFHDEIHPKSGGFKRVARLIKSEARDNGLWPS